ANASAVVVNLTVTNTTASSYLTAWPSGPSRALASNLNWPAGDTRPNLAILTVGTSGRVSLYNFAGSVDVIADVVGYFAPGSGGAAFHTMPPIRVLDSRDGTGGYTTPWGTGTTRNLTVGGIAGVPVSATA